MEKSRLATEIRAGVTTFVTMAYIIFVNPQVLSMAGMPKDGVMFATCIASAIATAVMGLYANYPFALAPGMGLNAYFTFGVVKGLGYSWQVALAAVFVEGLIFIALTLSRVRTLIINSIPDSMKYAVPVGIGLFIALIGMQHAGFITPSKATFGKLGDLGSFRCIMAFLGLLVASVLMVKRFNGALLVSIGVVTALAMLLGKEPLPKAIIGFPNPSGTLLKMDLSHIGEFAFWKAVIAFLFVDMFDTIGSLSAMGTLGGFMVEGRLPRVEKALMADAIGTTVGAALGTSTVTTYIESATGIAEGGRTGTTALVVAALFALSTVFYPLVSVVPDYATAPALIMVGILMASNVKKIPWDRMDEAIPAFLTLFFMPVTFSIANGLAAGFICYPIIKGLCGRTKEVPAFMWVLCAAFLIKYVFMP